MERETAFGNRQSLAAILSHAARHSPHYREQAWAGRLREGRAIELHDIPITPKALVRAESGRFHSSFVPPEDGEVRAKYTTGSTGEPMKILKTARQFQMNVSENRRLRNAWDVTRHRRIVDVEAHVQHHPLGLVEEKVLSNGARKWTIFSTDSDAVFDLLRRTSASLVNSFPSIVWGVLERSVETPQPLALQLIATVSEVVPDELRQLIRRMPDCRLADLYGCVEAGVIAVQCPRCDAYHPADRHLVVELVAEDGQPARPGEIGRVIVTPLFNRAMPLIRYETGDYAVAAEASDCPNAPPALARIIGRERNLFTLPDGRRISPGLPPAVVGQLALRRFKLLQTTPVDIEFHYVPRDPGTEIATAVAQEIVDRYMSPGFKVQALRVQDIPRSPGGKYLMHESLVVRPGAG